MTRVIFTEEAAACLEELVEILLKKEYFSFKDTADDYVEAIINFIETKIETSPKRLAPPRFRKFGSNLQYIRYRRNQHTVWYIFFIQKEDRFLITYITNNHVTAQHIRGL